MKRGSIIIPGGQKCGTTSLYEALCTKDEVLRPNSKEVQFLAMKACKIKQNIEWYHKNRKTKQANLNRQFTIDASTYYMSSTKVANNIKKYLDNPYVIIILRDPFKRAYSGFLQMKTKTPSPEKRTFAQITNDIYTAIGPFDKIVNPGDVVNYENRSIREAKDKIDSEYVSRNYPNNIDLPYAAKYIDELYLYRYYTNSIYSKIVNTYYEKLGSERVHVLSLESLVKNTKREMKQICKFLNIKYDNSELSLPKKNKTKVYKNSLFKRIMVLKRQSNILSKLWNIFNQKTGHIGTSIKNKFYKKEYEVSKEVKHKAMRLLASEYDYWENKECIDTQQWLRVNHDNK